MTDKRTMVDPEDPTRKWEITLEGNTVTTMKEIVAEKDMAPEKLRRELYSLFTDYRNKVEAHHNNWVTCPEWEVDSSLVKLTSQILSTIMVYFVEKVKAIENLYPDKRGFVAQREAFNEAIQAVLKVIEVEKW